jgi:DNA-binding NtrC family response regulator
VPDVAAEWIDACDATSVRCVVLPDALPHRQRALVALRTAAEADGLAWVRLPELAEVPAPAWGRSRSAVLVCEGRMESEAAAWLAAGFSRLDIVAVITHDATGVPWPVLGAPASPLAGSGSGFVTGRVAERDPWPVGIRVPPCSRIRTSPGGHGGAGGLERRGVALRRAGAAGAALAPLREAAERLRTRGAIELATRVAVHLVRALADAGRVNDAVRLAPCVEAAAWVVGRHRWSARQARRAAEASRGSALTRAWSSVGRVLVPSDEGRAREWQMGPQCPPGGRGRGGGDLVYEELLELLRAGHDDDEQPALARVCSVVRDRLRASAVGIVPLGSKTALAGAGASPFATDDLVRLAQGTAANIGPTAGAHGIEAAVPVRFAGAPVGVLCCRWVPDRVVDTERAQVLMTAAATAIAPGVRALMRAQPVSAPSETLGLLGVSPAIVRVREAIRRAAVVPFPVLVEGESGSGKELVARAVHEASSRRRRRFCAVNCAAISDELFEAEVFGHARGAYTGAIAERPGLFEEADGGTLFLDEVGELSPRGQAKLLRVIQDGEVRRVGENLPRRVDVRLVAASNRSLEREAAGGRFRDDLRFRLDVLRISVPPLRDRREDVRQLAEHFWASALSRTGGRARLDPVALDVLARYDWPGNVRELQNLMATLAVRAPRRGVVRVSDLPFRVASAEPLGGSLDEARRDFDARFVRATLARCGGRRAEAARQLGLSRQGLAKLMTRLGLPADEDGPAEPSP